MDYKSGQGNFLEISYLEDFLGLMIACSYQENDISRKVVDNSPIKSCPPSLSLSNTSTRNTL
jgi:hypothetical protein